METKAKRLKILFTIPNFDTAGSGRALLNIAMRLNRDEFEPHIMCMHDRGDFFNVVKESGIPVHLLEYTTSMKPYWKGLRACWKISRVFKSIGPDIIHSFHYAADYSEALAARLAGIKWLYTKKNMSWGGGSKNSWYLRSFLATHILAQNTDMIKMFFQNSRKVSLVPRGVNVGQFAQGSMDPELREKYGVKTGERIIICVANLVPVKGVEVLIEAFARLALDFSTWKLWIVGDNQNEYGRWLMEKVNGLSLGEKIIFTGKQIDVKHFLDQAEFFVLPTLNKGRMEGSPVSVLEAMANGKVVFASDIPGIRDQLAGFSNCLFQSGDYEELKNKLATAIQSDGSRDLGRLFVKHCSDNFSIEQEIDRHASVYKMVAC